LAIFKTWPEWTSTHQGTVFRMIACGIDNSMGYKSVAPFLGPDF
jgi:hypothetical protein